MAIPLATTARPKAHGEITERGRLLERASQGVLAIRSNLGVRPHAKAADEGVMVVAKPCPWRQLL